MKQEKDIKIAIIHPALGDSLTGSEMFALQMAEELKNKCNVTLLCSKKLNDLCRKIPVITRTQLYKTKNIFLKELVKLFARFCNSPEIVIEHFTSFFPLFFHLLTTKYDVLFPNNDWGGLLVCSIIRKIKGTPILFTEHASHIPACAVRNVKFKPDVYIALNIEHEIFIKNNYPGLTVKYIPNGVDLNKFNPDILPAEVDLPKPIVLAIGRNEKIKRLDLVIEAVSKLNNVSLLMVSTGDNLEELENNGINSLGEKRFKLFRSVKHEDIAKFYRTCDLFTLPSAGEACSLVYLEAMACNKPIVAPNDASRSEIIKEAGVLCDVTNVEIFSNALKQALETEWGTIPYDIAKDYGWNKIADKYFEVIKEMTN